MNALSQRLALFLADTTLRATALFALTALVAMILRRASASFRHFVWALGLGCALCLPMLTLALPSWHIAVKSPVPLPTAPLPQSTQLSALLPKNIISLHTLPRSETPVQTATAQPVPPHPLAQTRSPVTVPQTAPIPKTSRPMHLPWTFWDVLIWAIGIFFALARLAQGLLTLRQVTRKSIPVTAGNLSDAMTEAKSLIQVARPIALRLASAPGLVTVPITYGAWRPVVVLPAAAQSWSTERLQAALLHEMAHIRRGDWPLHILAHLTCSLYWFHPLAWVVQKQMRAESESACDDLVLAAGIPAQDYARHLLDAALSARKRPQLGAGAVAMAHSPKVERRLRAVLALGLSRTPVTQRAGMGVLAAVLLLIVPVAALRLMVPMAARGMIPQGPPVPAAAALQLQGDFTLCYTATITDLRSRQTLFAEYTQMHDEYQQLLKKYPHYQPNPVPEEAVRPFTYFLSRRPRTRHVLMTLSARDGHLLYRAEEGGDTDTYVYNGRDTQFSRNGHTGATSPGPMFDPDYPMPAVGLPYLPLLKNATLLRSSENQQTWRAQILLLGNIGPQNSITYDSAVAHAVREGGTWKLLDLDGLNQRFQFLQHQQLQGLWVASHMTLTKYMPSLLSSPRFSSFEDLLTFLKSHRTATTLCEYHLLSASNAPLGPADFDKHAVSRRIIQAAYDAGIRRDILHGPAKWRVVSGSQRFNTQVQQLIVEDQTARATVLEEDRATVIDPNTGRRHTIEATATFEDFWRNPSVSMNPDAHWILEKGRAEGEHTTMDGRQVSITTPQQAVLLDPNDADAQYLLAQALYGMNNQRSGNPVGEYTVAIPAPPAVQAEAIAHLRRAIALRPTVAEWHAFLAGCLDDSGHVNEAIMEERRTLHLLTPQPQPNAVCGRDPKLDALNADWYSAYCALGSDLVKTGHYQEAETCIRHTFRFKTAPNQEMTYLILGDALNGEGRHAEARFAWKKSLAAGWPMRTYNTYYKQAQARLAES